MSSRRSLEDEIDGLRARLGDIVGSNATGPLSPIVRSKLDQQLRELIREVEKALGRIDPISSPSSVFDPSNPKIIGRFTALAMVAQKKVGLAEISRFYGSGVYAIYYSGDFKLYSPLSGKETPIYVGQAAPKTRDAKTARDQGPQLTARLGEHRKNIAKAISTLRLEDFEARFLVVQSGWETAAEDYLIHLFKPIWNNETNILFGLGKHGDNAKTRANKRSPWDTVHPGRTWAEASLVDSKSLEEIERNLTTHFSKHHPIESQAALLEVFFSELRQG